MTSKLETEGVVVEALPNAQFKVKLNNGSVLLAGISGKMRMFNIRCVLGDVVTVRLTEYDLTRGTITFRHKR